MAIIKSFSSFQNLSNFSTFITDRNPNSDFFRVTEFKETFTGGKNGFLIEGSEFLKETTEVKIEVLDVEGNPIYYEPGKGAPDYYEGLSTIVSVHIYPDTPIGIGKITILGELKEYINENGTKVPVPEEWKGVYNVKWERTFKINRNLSNEDIVRFYRRPVVSISELVKPIFSKTIPSVTQSGSVEGIAIQPTAGFNLSNWTAGTLYKLKLTDGADWTGSVDENIISIPTLSYSPTVREVLNNREVLVNVPYSIGNIVTNFNSTPFETTFEYVEGQTVTESALTGSFARINISNLKTFVGDVARVKVFRKSRNEVTDFQFVQESKLESTELLRDITVPNSTEISYGNFSDFNLSNYWTFSNDNHPLSINVDVLQSSVKTEYNSSLGGVQHLITSESFSITKDVEYTLTFKTLISGSLNGSEYLRGYLSSSDGYQQTFLTVSGSDIYKTRQIVSQNIIANPISSSAAKLVFEISGSDWYISNVSLKNAQETSFSPDEFLLVQEIPRKLAAETFDFRFEFYDINNNYIPVDVNASAVFDGGNDFPTSAKLLTFESDRNAFRFSTGSIQNPENQVVKFTLTQNNLVGTPTFASAAFDVNGNYLNPSDYTGSGGRYPGFLDPITPAGGLLTINNFTGSYTGTSPTPYVGSIVYTASLDGLQEFETVYRLEDGENAPILIVTSDANQFIYEPTTLSPKPSGQSITIRAQRKNLSFDNPGIEVNSGSNIYPPLTEISTINGVTTYTLSADDFRSAFTSNSFDSVTYSFTGSDIYDNRYSDEITISKVVNFDGISLVLSNESVTFPANSTGEVIGGFTAASGSVQMFIGGNQIEFNDSLLKNTFEITNLQGSGCIPNGGNGSNPTTNDYGITSMDSDSASLDITVSYKAGDNSTTQSFQKVVSYTKAKKAVPTVLTKTSPTTQTINSSSAGFETPQLVEVVLQEGGDEYTYLDPPELPQTFKITGLGYSAGSASFSDEIITLFPSSSVGGIITSGIIGSASVDYRDSEGTLVQNKLVRFDLSVSKIGVDGLNGASGSNAKVVRLNSTAYAIKYDGDGNLAPSGQAFTLSGSAQNFSSPEFQFFQNGNDISNGFGGVSQIIIPTTTGSLPTPGASNLYEVRVRENGDSWNGVFDNIDVFGVQSGSDAFTVFLTNEAHTFTATSQSVVSPANISAGFTEVRFFRGTEQYTYNQSGGVGSNTYKTGSIVPTNITVSGSILSSQLKITPLTLDADQGSYVVPIIDNNTGTTLNKTYTFSKSKAGVTGADGVNGSAGSGSFTVSLTSNKYFVTYDQFGTLAPAGQTITLTATASLAFDSPQFQFLSGSTEVQSYSTTNTYSVSPLPTPGQTVLYQVNTREGGGGTVLAFDNIDVFGIQSGSDAFTVFLTNEAHTFAANSDGVITSTLADGATEVRFFRGTQQYTFATSGTNTYSVSATSSSIQLLQSTVSSQRKFTPTSVSGDAGTATITITDNNTSNQFVKTYTFTRSKKGAPSTIILANPQSQTVTSGSAGIGTPTNVSIIVNEGGANYTYALSGASTFNITNVTGGINVVAGTSGSVVVPTQPTNSTPISGIVTLNYRNSEGTSFTGKTINFNVGVAGLGNTGATGATGATGDTGSNGADGPGVVFRGPWSSTTTYFDTDDFPTRRDAVLYDGTYYATITNATTNLNKRPDLNIGTFWESLGTDDFFVAAKIAIFEESFVQNTINVGTNTSGNANIAIVGGTTSPYIAIGQSTQGYNQNGAFIGSDGTTGRLSLKSSTNSLLWDGTSLTINGGGTFTGTLSAGVLSSPTGNIGGFTIGGSQLYTGTKSSFASTAAGVYLGNDGIALGTNSPFKVTSGGALTATGVTVGGQINASSGTFTGNVAINGTLTAQNSKFGTAAGGSGNHGIFLATGNYWYDDGRFAVGDGSTKGIVWTPSTSTFTIGGDVNIGGSIASALLANGDNISALNNDALYQDNEADKTDGSVGGWAITTSTISAGNGRLVLSNSPYIAVLDTSSNVKVQIRTGSLTPLTGGSTTTLPSRTASVNWPLLTFGVTGQAFFGTSTTFTPASAGVYSGTVTCGAVGNVAFWNTNFSGYLQVQAYLQISDNASFSGSTNIFLLSQGEYPSGATSGAIGFPSGGSAFWQYNFATTNAHYIRMVWQRTVQGSNIASGISFSSATVTSSASAGATTINQVELTDEGFQVVNSSVYYFKVAREGYAGTTPFVQTGGDLSATGNIISYYSDRRLKDILGKIDNPLEKIKKLNGIYYKKNKLAEDLGMVNKMNHGRTEVGLIAQEVEEVLPEIVHLAPIDIDTDTGESISGENYLTIDYTKVVPLLVESVKELILKIEKLEEENKKLKDGDN